MNISDFAAVNLSGDDLVTALAIPGGGVLLILLAILAAIFWNIDPDNDEFKEGPLKGATLTLLILGGLALMVFGGANLYGEKNGPVRSANGEAVQEWAKDSYGVAISEDDAVSAAGDAKRRPHEEQILTVRGPDDRRLEVVLKVEENGDLYLMDPVTREELASR